MSLQFEWHERKAGSNLRKHRVSFEEAATIFSDPLSRTIPDDMNLSGEERLVTMGMSFRGRLLVVVHLEEEAHIRLISAAPPPRKGELMKMNKAARKTKVRSYDFSKGVRGKYAGRYAGSNVVVLAPDVAAIFKDSTAVNEALRAVHELAKFSGTH